ncbi:unnamed protein product [Pleuronectes platessa]|uniref:Uncharacterized protein n=1 Tax=Pleuronectes platessa TaxID=8262 RepID=A0A9N7ZBK6_PLEPL|nr:unnamed protein product [Pleuronectes platessa]
MLLSGPGSRFLALKCAAPASPFSWCWSRLQERATVRHGSLRATGGGGGGGGEREEEGETRWFFSSSSSSSRVRFPLRETESSLNGLYVDALWRRSSVDLFALSDTKQTGQEFLI